MIHLPCSTIARALPETPLKPGVATCLTAIGIIFAVGAVVAMALSMCFTQSYLGFSPNFLFYGGLGVGAFSILFTRHVLQNVTTRRQYTGVGGGTYQQSGSRINITVDRESVKPYACDHLDLLLSHILQRYRSYSEADINVQYIGQPGIDCGGLRKDYLSSLFQGLVTSDLLSFKTVQSSSLAVPTAEADEIDKLEMYKKMGQVMMWCYPNLLIGQILDPSVFHVACHLLSFESNLPYEELDFVRKVSLCQILLEKQNEQSQNDMMELLFKASYNWDQEDIRKAAEKALINGELLPKWVCEIDFDEVGKSDNQNKLREKLIEIRDSSLLYSQKDLDSQCDELRRLLAKRSQDWNSEEFKAALNLAYLCEVLPENLIYRDLVPADYDHCDDYREEVKAALDQINRRNLLPRVQASNKQKDKLQELLQIQNWNTEQIKSAAVLAWHCNILPENLKCRMPKPDLAEILSSEENVGKIRACLERAAKEYFALTYDSQLLAIHAFASGLKSMYIKGRFVDAEELNNIWDEENSSNLRRQPDHLCQTLQGRGPDPDFIISRIVCRSFNSVVQRKAEWLKEWIRCANPSDLKKLLHFITGSTGLPASNGSNGEIQVSENSEIRHIPAAHNCNNQIDFYPHFTDHDRTREGFFECIRTAIANVEGGFGFG